MFRRSTVTRALAAAALSLVPAVSAVSAVAAVPAAASDVPTVGGPGAVPRGDRLVVTVADSGDPSRDGTYELSCHPTGGDHPDAKGACDGLDEVTVWGRDPFAPVAPDAWCAEVHGGPATAHVRGRWAGRPVDAWFDRTDGCRIERWDRAVPLLPKLSPASP